MTTFDDTGIFGLDDSSPREPAPRRHHVVIVFVVAAALVVAGVAWLLVARNAEQATADQLDVELLARPAKPTDELAATVADETRIRPTTSRLAATTSAGPHYAAQRLDGDLCLVAVPEGDAPRVQCVAPSRSAAVTMTADDGSRVRLGTDHAPAPAAADGWTAAGPNVWVLAAPPAG